MSILCFLGLHRRSLSAIALRQGIYVSICEHCARPLVKEPTGRWAAAEPLDAEGKGCAAHQPIH
jgi:hypothetical protein